MEHFFQVEVNFLHNSRKFITTIVKNIRRLSFLAAEFANRDPDDLAHGIAPSSPVPWPSPVFRTSYVSQDQIPAWPVSAQWS